MQKKRIAALLLMGGKGERFQSEEPKQFHRLSGKKVYLHTLETFQKFPFDEIVLVCHPDYVKAVSEEVPHLVVPGGKTRQESSFLGLQALQKNTDIVLIHDAVRPFVSLAIIEANVAAACKYGAVDTCIPSADTIVHAKTSEKITTIPSRSEYLRGQTPQTFSYPLILKAHEETSVQNASDDCSLLLGKTEIHIVKGDENNLKITTELDLFLGEQLFRKRKTALKSSGSLRGKSYLIIGSTGGIGSATKTALEKEGAKVLSLSRSTKPFSLDLTKFDAKIFQKIYEKHGEVDGLINAAGLLKIKPVQELSSQEIEELMQVNITGLIKSCRSARIKKGGHIINLASSSCFRGRKNYGIYSAAKAAVVNFTQSFAEEAPYLVNAIVPTRCHTEMRRKNFPNEDPNSLLSPQKVSNKILQILKDSEITGSIIEIKK